MKRKRTFFERAAMTLLLTLFVAVSAGATETTTSAYTVDGVDYLLFTGFTATDGTKIKGKNDYEYMVDGNLSSEWKIKPGYADPSEMPYFVEFSSDSPIIPKGYVFNNYSVSNSRRKPTAWTLKAKVNQGDDWTELSKYSDQALWGVQEFRYSCNNAGNTKYQYFRFEVSTSDSDGRVYMTEIRLYGLTEIAYTFKEAKAATCAEIGLSQDCYYRNDGKYFADANGETELTDVVIPRIPHTWEYSGATETTPEHWQCSVCSRIEYTPESVRQTATSAYNVDGVDFLLFTGFTATDGTKVSDQNEYENMVDGELDSDWFIDTEDASNPMPYFVEFFSDQPIVPKGYVFNTSLGNSRLPTAWTLKAKSHIDEAWTTLSTYSGQSLGSNKEFRYICNNDRNTKYQYFRFEVSTSDSDGRVDMTEFRLYGLTESTYTFMEAKAATCSEIGISQDCYYRNDGKYFADANGETEVTNVVIPRIPHTWEYSGATETTPEHWQCSVCGRIEYAPEPARPTATSAYTVDGVDFLLFTGFTATDGTKVSDQNDYEYMVDGNLDSDWSIDTEDASNPMPYFVEFFSDQPIIPKGYVFNTSLGYSRLPTAWTLKAKSHIDEAWTTLSTYSGQSLGSNKEFRYTCNNASNTKYQYFRFEVSTSDSKGRVYMMEIRLYGLTEITYTFLEAKAATCSEIGISQDCYYRNDGKYFVDADGQTEVNNVVIPMIPHTGVHHPATEITVEYWQCSVCGQCFGNEGCTEELKRSITISPGFENRIYSSDATAAVGTSVVLTLGVDVNTASLKVSTNLSHEDVALTDNNNGTFTFVMPAEDVTVTASLLSTYSVTLPEEMVIVTTSKSANCEGKYISGTVISFKTAHPYSESNVKNGSEPLTATDGIYSVTIGDADVTITATFERLSNITLSKLAGPLKAEDGDVLNGYTKYHVTIADGAQITLSETTIKGGIICEGNATITISGSNSVTGSFHDGTYRAGIQVGGTGTTLTIKGDGSLYVTGEYMSAGIGLSSFSTTGGNIVIESGNLTVTGGKYGAGIGTGSVLDTASLGNIIIKSGSLNVTGGIDGNGIGKGELYSGASATFGQIAIYDDIELVEASSISEPIVYKHGETDVTSEAYKYFRITENGDRRTIKPNLVTVTLPDHMFVYYCDPSYIKGDKYLYGALLTLMVDYPYTAYNVKNGNETLAANMLGFYEVHVTNVDITITADFVRDSNINLNNLPLNSTVENGDVLTGTTYQTIHIADDATVTLKNATIYGGIVCDGEAEILLDGTNRVTGITDHDRQIYTAGIQVGTDSPLTIDDLEDSQDRSIGVLYVTGGYLSAAIGTSGSAARGAVMKGGSIYLYGAMIFAKGGEKAAAVGTGAAINRQSNTIGHITITNGWVTAIGGKGAEGIGKGYTDSNSSSSVMSVNIYDEYLGSVEVTNLNRNANFVNVIPYDGGQGVLLYDYNLYDRPDDVAKYFNITNHDERMYVLKNTGSVHNRHITLANNIEHGTIAIEGNLTEAQPGLPIIVNATPESGYCLEEITVFCNTGFVDRDHLPVYVDNNVFFMPRGDVTISATFTEDVGTISTGGAAVEDVLELADASDNISAIADASGKTYNRVTLKDRTLYKDGDWNTLCLPFDMTAAQVTAQLAPAKLMKLDGTTSNLTNGTLTLNFTEATTISAGVPYIIKWTKAVGYDYASTETRDMKDPLFTVITIPAAYTSAATIVSALESAATTFTGGKFTGSYAKQTWDTEDKSILFLGAGSTLYYPQPSGGQYPSLNAFRAYFKLADGTQAREFKLNFGGDGVTTSIENVQCSMFIVPCEGAWYDIQGRKLDKQPTKAGLYIHNGRKVVVK